jgi:putative hemolysin
MLALEIAVVALLIVVNGVLAMSELAVVSARPARLKAFAERGVRGAEAAMALNGDPGRFLSTVQIGITLVGILAGAFSGATLAQRLADVLRDLGMPGGAAEPIGFGVVVSAITYVSLIVGELVPKQLALRDPERIACAAAPAMTVLASVAKPIVFLLDLSGRLALRLLGQGGKAENKVTDEEIRTLVAEAETAGVIEPEERRLIAGVMRLGDRPVRGVMTPRRDVDMIDLTDGPDAIREAIKESIHSRLPVHNGNPDEPIGIIQVRDLLDAALAGQPFEPRNFVREAPVILDQTDAVSAIAILQNAAVHFGLVHDEYGHFQGVVSTIDILEAIAGEFRDLENPEDPPAVSRPDGSWLISGLMPADEFADILAIELPQDRDYQTAAGFALDVLGRLPATGDGFTTGGWTFEVVDMDGRRIDKLLATPIKG